MKITDNRGKTEELSFEDLVTGYVYISHRKQAYCLFTWLDTLVNLETGEIYIADDVDGDIFTLVKSHLVIE